MSVTLNTAAYAAAVTFNFTAGTSYRPAAGALQDTSTKAFVVGTAAGQVNKEYAAQVTLTAGGSTAIDLTALLDQNGQSLAFGVIEALKVTNQSTTAGQDVTVGGGTYALLASVSTSLKATVRGDSLVLFVTPITVDATHKLLQLAAVGIAGQTYTVLGTALGR